MAKYPLRFLHVIRSLDRRDGGPVEALLQIGLSHINLGHSVEALCLDVPDAPHIQNLTFPVHALGPARGVFGYCPRMKTWVARNGPRFDAVIVHGLWNYPAIAVREALPRSVPYFVYAHGMLDPWFNDTFPLKHVKKTVFWHTQLRRTLDAAAGIIFTTEEEMERSIRSFFPFRWHGMVAPLGIAAPPDDAAAQIAAGKARIPELKDARYLLFLGRIHPKKGCDLLVRAFSTIASSAPDIHLVMAGPGDPEYVNSLKSMLAPELAGRVVWTGMVSGATKWGLLRAADAFVLPSHQENFAIATVEAMAASTPVLISDKVQIWREVSRSRAGLVDSDTAEGTERLLLRWMELRRDERETLRKNAAECYRTRFTAEQAGRTLLCELKSRLLGLEAGTTDALRALCEVQEDVQPEHGLSFLRS